jgi:hypothetical protein
MEPFIIFAIIIAFSIMDSIARKKRAGMQLPPGPDESEGVGVRAQWPQGRPTRDADVSYDDVEIRREAAAPAPTSSEAMVPAEIWEEIIGLASGSKGARPVPKPAPRPVARQGATRPTPTPIVRSKPVKPVRATRTAPAPPAEASESDAIRSVHLSHREFGTDPSQRSRSAQDGLDPLRRERGADPTSARHQLRSKAKHALRQAVILHEVLEPPVALQPDRYSDFN